MWRKDWKGSNISFDYHFWIRQYYDVGGISFSNVISEDMKFYEKHNVHGVIGCGATRAFFPTGLGFYVYARTMFDTSLTLEELTEDYFSHAFGEDWKKFYDYLKELGDAFNHYFLSSDMFQFADHSPYYWPEHAESLSRVRSITEKGRALIKEYYNSPFRVRTVSVRILEKHALYADLLADALIPKVLGKDDEADALYEKFKNEFGKEEMALEPYYDHTECVNAFSKVFTARTKVTEAIL